MDATVVQSALQGARDSASAITSGDGSIQEGSDTDWQQELYMWVSMYALEGSRAS